MGGGWRRLDRRVIDGIRGGKVGIRGRGRKERGAVIGVYAVWGAYMGHVGGLREYIWPADAVHVGVAA